jgi:predicted nucleic acid-binding protein
LTRYLLDTNILSDAVKPRPSAALEAWMIEQTDESLFASALNIAEIRQGILLLPSGKRRRELEKWFEGTSGPSAIFAGRILAFDEHAAFAWASLMAEGRSRGQPRSPLDMIVAAIAKANDCVVVTDNERDFSGLDVFNPMRV